MMEHQNINRIINYDFDGVVSEPNGQFYSSVAYSMFDYIEGITLEDLCLATSTNGLGEHGARVFFD